MKNYILEICIYRKKCVLLCPKATNALRVMLSARKRKA